MINPFKHDRHFLIGYVLGIALATIVVGWLLTPARAAEYQLPPEVTPALKNACEHDFRRFCLIPGETPTRYTVWTCIKDSWHRITKRCQTELKVAGLAP